MPEEDSDSFYSTLKSRRTRWGSPLGVTLLVATIISIAFCVYFFVNRFYTSKTELQTLVEGVEKDATAINTKNGCWLISEAEFETSVSSTATSENGVNVVENKVGTESESGHKVTLTLVPNKNSSDKTCPAPVPTEADSEAASHAAKRLETPSPKRRK